MRAALVFAMSLLSQSAPAAAAQCAPVPVVVQTPSMAPNSTYSSDAEPPKRFGHAPTKTLKIVFGDGGINATCGQPPCGKVFLGCDDGDRIALPDPFSMSDEQFARTVRHELAHVNGWPATHGD